MSDDPQPPRHDLPAPDIAPPRRWHVSLIWLVPLVAALVGLGLVIRTYVKAGPTIVITFKTAEGLEPDKTEVKYKNVAVGRVKSVSLSKDHSHVVVRVELGHRVAGIAVEDTRFWVERPRVGLSGISGISTVLSGAYIGVDIGTSHKTRKRFVGLEKPPAVTHDQAGRRFVLHSSDLGSLVIGSPVYYRRVPVGRVSTTDLDPDGKGVTVQVFVDAPYDRFVTGATRFWNASGINLSVGAQGLKLNAQSIATIFAGGIGFATPDSAKAAPADQGAEFQLFDTESAAMSPPDGPPLLATMHFEQSTRGLSVGAPVNFRGISVGDVRSIKLQYDTAGKNFYADTEVELYLNRLGPAYETLRKLSPGDDSREEILRRLVAQGLRGQLSIGNLITGQMYVALDFVPKAQAAKLESRGGRLLIPTAPGSIEQIQKQLQDIVDQLHKMPFGEIGNHLNGTLRHADGVLRQLDDDIAPQARQLLDDAHKSVEQLNANVTANDAPLQRDARSTLEEIGRAAYSLRALSDYLEQHPEAILRGKTEPAVEPAPKAAAKP
jgi:paraquat-inducible protein B